MGHRCHWGRPSPDAFLCTTCTKELDDALADLGKYLPELAVTVTRQDRTSRAGRNPWCTTLGAHRPHDSEQAGYVVECGGEPADVRAIGLDGRTASTHFSTGMLELAEALRAQNAAAPSA